MNYTIYRLSTGVISRIISVPDEPNLLANVGSGEGYIEGHFDPDLVYVDRSGEPRKYTPARPAPWAIWDGQQWIDPRGPEAMAAEIEMRMEQIRIERDRRLAASDWTQLPDAPLTEVQRAAWRAYRQALRDFPATSDPDDPIWPDQP